MRGKAVIAGVGQTTFGKLPGRGTISMNVEACRRALEDAGIEKDAVDALFLKTPTSRFEGMYGQKVAEASKRWFRVADTYGVEVAQGVDPALILAITVVLDAMAHPAR